MALDRDRAGRPAVSVLMPVYNAAPYLEAAIESILSQTYGDFEFVIVDDGSTDDSLRMIQAFAGKDGRIRLLRHEANLGIVKALNDGLSACRGEWVARMDADDIALPDRLERQQQAMAADASIGALGGALAYIDAQGRDLGLIRRCSPSASPLSANPLLHPTVMLRRSICVQNNLAYQEEYRYAEDYYLWLEIRRHAAIAALEDVVLKYRIHDQASRSRYLKQMLRATLRVKKDGILKLGLKPSLLDLVRMLSESFLLLLPGPMVWRLYNRLNRMLIQSQNR